MKATVALFIGITITAVLGYPSYQPKIPNGYNVPNPCGTGLAGGVGHISPSGGGPRNQFGMDFSEADSKWTEGLCQKDSDDDGLSNGEELGDPYCVWIEGTAPNRTTGITHPGVNNAKPNC